MASRSKKKGMQWYRIDLHLHTPASADYQEPGITYLDILQKAERRGLDIIAFTDHNSVAGYGAMMRHVEQLTFLERLDRATPEERRQLTEYRRLLDKVLVLPGFEFTATFGFHILGIFSPHTPLRQIEHLLLNLRVPVEALDRGITEVGASSDVLTAYRLINEAGGIAIAAHANSSHGVAMRGFDFGGQTKIAYTQDPYLHCLEVTDLTSRARTATSRFFDGTKTEYPRRMRCIQGSDAHRLNAPVSERAQKTSANLGVGDRVTEVALPERTFEALIEMFRSNDFSRTRAYSPTSKPVDYVQQAREEGVSIVQSFHEAMTQRGGFLYTIVADVCALANTNGGTIYVGLDADPKKPPVGISNSQENIGTLGSALSRMITPPLDVEIDTQETGDKTVIRIRVPRGDERPYAVEDNKIYVREETETSLAVRDEIVNLVRQGLDLPPLEMAREPETISEPVLPTPAEPEPRLEAAEAGPPRAGVEIVGVQQKGETTSYQMHDLRNGNIVKNVTRSSARRLWHYAITQRESNPVDESKVQWLGNYGLWQSYRRAGETRYDLIQRQGDQLRVYYGVTEGGMHGPWLAFLAPEGEAEEEQGA